MFGLNNRKNSYDDTSVMEQGGQEYGSDIHGVALSVNKIVWDMLKVLKKKKLFGFHFSAKLGIKKTIIIMTHEDRKMLNKGQKILHNFQKEENIILLTKLHKSKNSQKDILEEDNSNVIWKSKIGISTIIGTMVLISIGIYYSIKYTQNENFKKSDNNISIKKRDINIEKNIEINVEMMNALSKSFDNKENKKVKEVLAQVLEISTSTDILEEMPGYEKVKLDNDKILSTYEDPNLKYVIKDGNDSMGKLNKMAQAYSKENNITQTGDMLKELKKIGKEVGRKTAKNNTPQSKNLLNELKKIGKEVSKKSSEESNTTQSKGILKELISIEKNVGKRDSDSYDEVAKNLNTLGDISLHEGDSEGAKNSFSEALTINKGLAKKNPRRYEMRVAKNLTNLAVVNLFQNNKIRAKRLYNEAESRYKRIVELYRSLVKKEPKIYKAHLAYSLNNLANLYVYREQNLSKAIKPSKEALSIYKQLDKTKHKKYSKFLVLTLHKTASIYNKEKKFKTAINLYNELIEYCKKENNKEYYEHIAKSLNALAWIYTKEPKLRDIKKAKAQLHEAIKLYEKLIKNKPKRFIHILSLSYSHLGYIASIEGDNKTASKMYKKALEIFNNFDNNISYAIFLSKDKKYKEANRVFKSIVNKYKKKEEQAYALKAYGEFYMDIDKTEGKKKLDKSLKLYSELSNCYQQ